MEMSRHSKNNKPKTKYKKKTLKCNQNRHYRIVRTNGTCIIFYLSISLFDHPTKCWTIILKSGLFHIVSLLTQNQIRLDILTNHKRKLSPLYTIIPMHHITNKEEMMFT